MADADLCLKEIGRRIIERRRKLGLTQEALAEKGDVTAQFVSYAEAGKRAMRPENLLKIASALGVSADYLLTGEIVDKDLLLLADKLRRLTPNQIRIVESVIDECCALFGVSDAK
jgi:transcriptional regulator with XRE-family HTH domain